MIIGLAPARAVMCANSERDESSADEEHAAGQVFEFEEVGAVDQVLVAGEVHGRGRAPVAIRKCSDS
jgi:hypothetical protein